MSANWKKDECPLCKSEIFEGDYIRKAMLNIYNCEICGAFQINDKALLNTFSVEEGYELDETLFKIACFMAENNLRNPSIFRKLTRKSGYDYITYNDAIATYPKTAAEIYNRSLLNLSTFFKHPFDLIEIKNKKSAQYFFSQTINQFCAIVSFLADSGFVNIETETNVDYSLLITPSGWQKIEELQRTNTVSKQGFVAMWFAPDHYDEYSPAISEAIKDAGFNCKIIAQKETNNKICDEIIAEIKQSKFVIADVTGHRGGVFFEAGYAMGMGLPVIWLVHKDHETDMHFDTRQYSHIMYESEQDLKEKLYQRIRATI